MPRVNGKEFPYTAAGMAAAARERAKKRAPKKTTPPRKGPMGSVPQRGKTPAPSRGMGKGKVKAPNRVTRPNMIGRKPGRMQRRGY